MRSKGNNKQNVRQPMNWEKTFASHISDNGLISKGYKEIMELNSKMRINLLNCGQRT